MRNAIPMLTTFVVATAVTLNPPVSAAQQTAEAVLGGTTGQEIFRTYCGSCHGKTGKGDGPLADVLRLRPADLTLIARHNGGLFPADKVHRTIDGRERSKSHGDTDMPVWGDAFKRSGEGYSEAAVKIRIDALVEYLKTVQAK